MSSYRHFQSPEGEIVRVKQGFSWQAFFVGSLTTMVRRLWWVVVLAGVAGFVVARTDGMPELGTRGIALGGAAAAMCVLYMLFCGFFGNRWLVESLRRRGFRMVGEEAGRKERAAANGAAPATRTVRASTSPSR